MVIYMIYLDYSATTPVDKEVLDSFYDVTLNYMGNPNSLHKLGTDSKKIIDAATNQIAKLLNINPSEVIYTSGASESNNLAIKGICLKYQNRGKHIITTEFEHSSIYGPLNYLQSLGFEVDFVKTDEFGRVDLNNLKELLRDDTILVSITAVNSEIGIKQPIKEIGELLKDYYKCFFHVDMTQSITKEIIDVSNVDLFSFSAHKFFGIKGIGVLVKKDKISLEPIIHGGKSTTVYRSGTPSVGLIISISKALRLGLNNLKERSDYVTNLRNIIIEKLSTYELVRINSNNYCIPNIINISVLGVKPETLLHKLEEYNIFISTQTACSSKNDYSKAVYSLTKDIDRAKSSIRISISYKTKEEEIEEFLRVFDICYKDLIEAGVFNEINKN